MTKTQRIIGITSGLALAMVASATAASAQVVTQRPGVPAGYESRIPTPLPGAPAPSYIIGPDDVLSVRVWNESDGSSDVIVRPDGKITVATGGDVMASGLTVDELKEKVIQELKKWYDDPTVSIQVKQINSRRVYITGAVAKPGVYPLIGSMNVNQLVTTAGGLLEFANKKELLLISATLKARDGSPFTMKINYKDLMEGKNLPKNNPELRPGDQLIVKGG